MKKNIFYGFAIIILLILILKLTPWLFVERHFQWYKYLLRAFILTLNICFSLTLLVQLSKFLKRKRSKNVLAFFSMALILFFILEFSFMFIPISSGGANSLCAKNWFNYYWKENSLGFRDPPPLDHYDKKKKNLLIIGDSYVAGHGIKTPAKRFSDILKERFNNKLNVFNLGVCGADTQKEYANLIKFPVKPDIIMLAHTPNDIENVLSEQEVIKILNIGSDKPDVQLHEDHSNFLVNNSFILNFIALNYTRFINNAIAMEIRKNYKSFDEFLNSEEAKHHTISYYNNESLLNVHLSHIDRFVEYAKENDKQLIVLLFPKLSGNNIETSNKYVNVPIKTYLDNKNIATLNLHSIIRDIDEDDRIINRYDFHPNEKTNQVIAQYLTKHFRENNFLED